MNLSVEFQGYKGKDVVLLKFSPRIDGDFFPAHPDILIKDAKHKPVSIIGVGEKEDSFFSKLFI